MIYLSIGSNLDSKFGNKFENIKKTLEFIKKEKIEINKVSSFYETPSYPNNKKPKFINIVVEVNCSFSPIILLKKISLIEKKLGRIRNVKNEPRTCDIDIIDFKNVVIKSKKIILPHPRAIKRNFVLYPLMEICPTWKNPIDNKKIHNLIKKICLKLRNEITRLPESVTIKK